MPSRSSEPGLGPAYGLHAFVNCQGGWAQLVVPGSCAPQLYWSKQANSYVFPALPAGIAEVQGVPPLHTAVTCALAAYFVLAPTANAAIPLQEPVITVPPEPPPPLAPPVALPPLPPVA